jgi:hypothetical protein
MKNRQQWVEDYFIHKNGTINVIALLEFNRALYILKKHGLCVYCVPDGSWTVHRLDNFSGISKISCPQNPIKGF